MKKLVKREYLGVLELRERQRLEKKVMARMRKCICRLTSVAIILKGSFV